MNWFDKAFSITALSLWIHPYWVGFWMFVNWMLWVLGLLPDSIYGVIPIPVWLPFMMTMAPTLVLRSAIGQSILLRSNKLPDWAWFLNTPDSPYSPYSFYEKAALPYYKYGRFIGDYLWLALRNSWYGLSFHWGVTPDPTWKWTVSGDPYTADTNPETKQFVYGHLSMSATKNGVQQAWAKRGVFRVGSKWMLKYWFGWKLSEYVQPGAKPVPPAMLAIQIEPRKAV